MSLPQLTTVAEGDLPSGQHWILRVGGTREDFYTFLETVHPDGQRDQGGMGGPLLYPGRLLNTYSGGDDRGLLRLIVRADPRVARLRLTLTTGERPELAAVATDSGLGVSYFAALLPRTTGLAALTPLDPPATQSPPSPQAPPAHPLAPASSSRTPAIPSDRPATPSRRPATPASTPATPASNPAPPPNASPSSRQPPPASQSPRPARQPP